MDKFCASKYLLYYIFQFLKGGICSKGIVEKGINIQATTICYNLQDRDMGCRNAVEFQIERTNSCIQI